MHAGQMQGYVPADLFTGLDTKIRRRQAFSEANEAVLDNLLGHFEVELHCQDITLEEALAVGVVITEQWNCARWQGKGFLVPFEYVKDRGQAGPGH